MANGCYAIIAAGGSGNRMGNDVPKQYIEILGKPVIAYTITQFEKCESVDGIVVAVSGGYGEHMRRIAERFSFSKIVRIVAGGPDRQSSVAEGLRAVPEHAETVLVHDAVRPFVSVLEIENVVKAAREFDCAVLAAPVKDTIKTVEDGFVVDTPDRSALYAAQTPQGFSYALLSRCHTEALRSGTACTDDVQLAERLGIRPRIVRGSYLNIKVTTPDDLIFAETIIKMGRL